MSRETQRQINRLRRLADYIEQNPTQFAMAETSSCIVGLGLKLSKKTVPLWNDTTEFARLMGVSSDVALSIYVGVFSEVNPRAKDVDMTQDPVTNKRSVNLLRWMANQKVKGKEIKYYGN